MRSTLWLLAPVILGGWSTLARAESSPVNFARDVVPVLTKAGCNAGSCHGSFQGRGGFRLSLLGFDPLADYQAIVEEARGRRVFPAAPEYSLLLRKPTGEMAHGGKKRLAADSEGYRILRDWIRQGLPAPRIDGPAVVRLEVTPKEVVLQTDRQTPLQVRAIWSDGFSQDATSWALYESTEDTVAEVSATGAVMRHRPGRAAITVRYLGQVAAVAVTVPHATPAQDAQNSHNFIDDFIVAEWKKLGVQPAALADDAEFVRRVHLDLIGTLPTPEEVRRFLDSKDAAKRSRLIDELLERPEYVDYWALKWGDLLRAHRRALGEKGLMSFHGWLRQALRQNQPLDRIVRELLTAQGNLYTNGPVAFYYVDQTPEELAETTAQVFLGVRLQCAKCHHHPYEVWGQDDYYGLAAYFAGIQRKDTKEDGRYGGAQTIRLGGNATVTNPATRQVIAPRVLGHPPVPAAAGSDPRQALATWITQKDNPYFARNFVNRYWGYLFGRGLVEPIDDLRATNPASHPALLEALAQDFVKNGYDVKRLLRTLCNARVYQLASEVAPRRDQEGVFFTHRRPRRLPAEVLLDAINQAVGAQEKFDETGRSRFGVAQVLPGTRAIALPDPTVTSYFLDTFGRPNRTSTCECERGSKPDLSQILHLVNSDSLHEKVTSRQGRAARLLAAKKSDAAIIDELYLATLSRLPTAQERERVREALTSAPTRAEGFEDLLWALLNTAEFISNH